MIRFLPVLLLLITGWLHAADITITGPNKPINPGRMVRLMVIGLTDQELMRSSAIVSRIPSLDDPVTVMLVGTPNPLDGVDIFPGKTWNNKPYIDFMSQYAGKFEITIDVNLFRRALDEALTATESADIEPLELVSELRIAVVKITDKYVAKSGSALVEVAGDIPPPPGPKPPGPLPPTTKVNRVTYVWEKDIGPIPAVVAKALQRINAEFSGSVVATDFEDDTKDGNGEVPDQYKVALGVSQKEGVPILVVQSGQNVVKIVKSPMTEADILGTVK